VVVTILASIGYSVLTPINMMKTEKGMKEASEGDEVLLEGITCSYSNSCLICDVIKNYDNGNLYSTRKILI
jgi:hypothetical protein